MKTNSAPDNAGERLSDNTQTSVVGSDFGLSEPFVLLPNGIYKSLEGGELKWICSPLKVVALYSNESGKGWGRVVAVEDRDGHWHELPVDESELSRSPSKIRSRLQDLGLRMPSGSKVATELMRVIGEWEPHRRMLAVDRLGWTNGSCTSFVLGSGRVIGSGDVLPRLQGLSPIVSEIHPKGTIEHWKSEVAAKCRENPLLLLAVSLAFSGPLLDLLDLDLGGGLHYRGASSRGKSTAIFAATSVWGSPRLKGSWRATTNGLEAFASSLNGMLLTLDEMAETSGRELGQAIYMLANGVPKTRMGSSEMRVSTKRWRLPILSSGEISVKEKLQEAGQKEMGGHQVRLVDVEADTRRFGLFDYLHGAAGPGAFSDTIKCATSTSYGTAGPLFVERLLSQRASVSDMAANFLQHFESLARVRLAGADAGEVARVIKRFALIALAGELATTFGLTGWEPNEAKNAGLETLVEWHDRTMGPKQDEAADHKARVQEFLTLNAGSLVDLSDASAPVPLKPLGWRDSGHFYFPQPTWATINANGDPTLAARALRDAGILLAGDGRSLARKAPRSVDGRPRVYVLKASAFGEICPRATDLPPVNWSTAA